MKEDKQLKASEVINKLLEMRLCFSTRIYENDSGKLVLEVFAKKDWCAVAGIFPRGVFDLDMDDRKSPIAKAVFII